MNKIISKGKNILISPQGSILSAASVIMIMILASGALGLVRDRILLSFFVPEQFTLFKASFRFPDLFLSVLALGTLSSAYIPVFTKTLKHDEELAWDTAARIINLGLIIYLAFLAIFILFAEPLYSLVAPGFSEFEIQQIASLARWIFLAQGFFIISYAFTGALESHRRFLIPALAPIFYNVGIIIGTLMFSGSLGLMGPVIGVLIGAMAHLTVQLPLAVKLGFRFRFVITPTTTVKKIARLASPRMIELSLLQLSKMVELALASLISTASYAYFTLAVSAQSIPVALFGTAVAKAALPTLARQSEDHKKFAQTLLTTIYQIIFLIMPLATILIVLRIPIIRLLFGTSIFGWEATVQTGLVLSTFAFGVPFQALVAVLTRAFYATQNTKTPVFVSLTGTLITITTGSILVLGFGYPTWALAASFTLGVIFQSFALFYFLDRAYPKHLPLSIIPLLKSAVASLVSGATMYFILKFFDRAVWVKRLSFLTNLESLKNLNFESFVLDTRYTSNLLILSTVTALIGGIVYLAVSFLLGSNELKVTFALLSRGGLGKPPRKEPESLTPTTQEQSSI